MNALLPQVCPAADLQTEDHIPVVIVGAGACGLTAALALHRLGVACVVLERDAFAAGSTALSSGFIPAPRTQAQLAQGITDSVDLFVADIQAKAHGQAAAHLVQAYALHIGPALDALANHHGLPWQVLDNFLYPGHSAHRMHAVPEKTGAALMSRLQAATDAAGVVVLTQSQVTELFADETQRLHGVGYMRPDGQTERLRCDVVLLACNGFGGAAPLVKKFLPEMAEATYAGHVGNDGSAIAWGQKLGARLADLGAYQGHGSWAVPQGALISWALMMEGGVQINALGQRFHDETQGYSEAAVHVLAQPGGVAWNVFDGALLQFAQDFPDFVAAQSAGAVQHAEDVNALAKLIGCSTDSLQKTFDAIAAGTDPATHRHFKRRLQAPFCAIKVTGALFHTQGGLDIDADARVLREDGQPLPNLLAAGGAARGVSGQEVWGYLSGNGLLSAIAGGHIAAHTAEQILKDAAP
ncbi:MAG: Fumarate reductase flavoprotein subunit precursor [Pseudomonadota bacterium]